MPQPALGLLLRRLREARGLSLRELANIAEIDHAYIYRLETGAKESPSDDVISKLVRALKASKRDAEMLRYLATHSQADVALVEYVLTDSTIPFEVFAAVAGAAYRSNSGPDYPKLVERFRRYLSDEDNDG